MDPNANLTTLLPFAAFSGIVGYLVSLVKPYIEKIPALRPGSDLHDPSLRMLSVALNVAVAIGYGYYSHALPSNLWPNFAIAGLLQAAGSEAYYKTVTRSGLSIGDSGLKSVPKNLLAPVALPGASGSPPSVTTAVTVNGDTVASAAANGKSSPSFTASIPPEVLADTDAGIASHIN